MHALAAPMLGLVLGALALACAPINPTELDLEFAEGSPPGLADPGLADEDDPSLDGGVTEVEVPEGLPTAHCTPSAQPSEAVEVDDPIEPGSGRLLTTLPDGRVMGLPLRHTSFDVMVVGTVAETTVVQRFENSLPDPIEVVYTFPLPHDGAVDDYALQVGERRVRGKIRRRAEAQEIYDEAKQAGHTAGLLEQERPNVFTQRVANVGPGEVVEVSMHVVQPLRPEGGRYELVLPTVVGPRHVPGVPTGTHVGTGMLADTDAVPDASRITPPVLPPRLRSCADLEIEVSIDAGGPIAAVGTTSHRITVEPDHLGALVRLDERFALLDRDFVLSWRRDGAEPRATLQAQPDDDGRGGYFTLTVQPPAALDPAEVPGRELVFVVDASGSMMGEPMDVAKATMRRFITGLRPDDAFQVLRFSDAASGLGEELLPVDDESVARALAYVDALEGEGGTSMTAGVQAALGLPRRSDRVRMVVFLTDGYIGNEAEVFQLVAEHIGDARLFSLGVGSSVNRYLLDGMARMGRGAATYVDLTEPTDPVVERIYQKLRQPALVDLAVEFEGLDVRAQVPEVLPDLFVGEPVVVLGRYEGKLEGRAVIRGRRGDATIEIPVALRTVRDEDVDGVRSMWAREHIRALEHDPSLAWASDARLERTTERVVELSLRHRVLTEHTAFVAVDESRVVLGRSKGKTVVQGVQQPSGVAYEATWGHVGVPAGPTGEATTSAGGGAGSGYGSGRGAGFGGRGGRVPVVRQARATVKGSLDRVIIQRIVRAHLSEVRHCYNKGLAIDASLAGRVLVEFTIGALGEVVVSTVASNELPEGKVGESVGRCIATAVTRWTFPKTPGGGLVLVRYPFLLSVG
jgi:Ca-activated chloride channel family protein